MEERWNKLREFLINVSGCPNCYFIVPSGVKMQYPCIKVSISGDQARYADNKKYMSKLRWTLTVIYREAFCSITTVLDELKYCRFEHPYFADNLNHSVYTLYF